MAHNTAKRDNPNHDAVWLRGLNREGAMALEMRDKCEKCAKPLAMDGGDTRICSYECTFCAACTNAMHGVCPNCGGELLPRPRRAKKP
jgi:uncharacterized protein